MFRRGLTARPPFCDPLLRCSSRFIKGGAERGPCGQSATKHSGSLENPLGTGISTVVKVQCTTSNQTKTRICRSSALSSLRTPFHSDPIWARPNRGVHTEVHMAFIALAAFYYTFLAPTLKLATTCTPLHVHLCGSPTEQKCSKEFARHIFLQIC